jgi:PAS domain S-box-containing protein
LYNAIKMTRVLRRLVWFCIGGLLLVGGTVEAVYWVDRREHAYVDASRAVMQTARTAAELAGEAEAEVWGFRLTAGHGSLAPEVIDRTQLLVMVDSLESLVGDNPAQARRAHTISAAVRRWDNEFATPVIAGQHLDGQGIVAGEHLFDKVRASFEDFMTVGQKDMSNGESHVRQTQVLGTAAVLGELFIFLGILLLVIRGRLMRDASDLSHQQHLLKQQTVELEVHLQEMESVNGSLSEALTETARKDVELRASLQGRDESAAFLDSALSSSPVGFAFWGADLRYLRINENLASTRGLLPKDFIGRTMEEVSTDIAAQVLPILKKVLSSRAAVRDVLIVRVSGGSDGSTRHMLANFYPVITCSGKFLAIGAVVTDVTERYLREEALRKSEERYRYVSLATNDAVWDWDLGTGTIDWSDGVAELFGYDLSEVSSNVTWWAERIHPDDCVATISSIESLIAGKGSQWIHEYRFRRKDGTYSTVYDKGYVLRASNGRAVRIIGAMADRTKEENLEAQLRQSQKMDAIGRLAGGVAHDFNNILTVIGMSSEFLLEGIQESDERHHDAREIMKAADRGGRLTRQLLAFSRQQVLNPRVLCVNEVIEGMQGLLRRVVRENIELVTDLAPDLGAVKADAGQIEQVLLNLAINASDAMPNGGKLVVRTHRVQVDSTAQDSETRPGPYVCITVIDTGTGMDKATVSKIFEPFFTTKALGKGTGLGLATVHGIVTQSKGTIWVYSEPGKGTTFKIFLPRVDGVPDQEDARPTKTSDRVATETILLVEDEEPTREAVRRILAREGYRVLEARTGVDALEVAQAHEGEIHFLLTDSMMPEMSGADLVPRLTEMRPNVRVLMMSGYAEEIARTAFDGSRYAFIEKPFTTVGLLNRVREVLNS